MRSPGRPEILSKCFFALVILVSVCLPVRADERNNPDEVGLPDFEKSQLNDLEVRRKRRLREEIRRQEDEAMEAADQARDDKKWRSKILDDRADDTGGDVDKTTLGEFAPDRYKLDLSGGADAGVQALHRNILFGSVKDSLEASNGAFGDDRHKPGPDSFKRKDDDDNEDHNKDDSDMTSDDFRSDDMRSGVADSRHDSEWKKLTAPHKILDDWVPQRADRESNGGFASAKDSGSPVPYTLNGHVDIERESPWGKKE